MGTKKAKTIGELKKPYEVETVRIKNSSVLIEVNTISGMDGDYWVYISPSLNVSGYGKTLEEAFESFDHNMDVFTDDLINMKSDERTLFLIELGWSQKKFAKKNFSKAYVDEYGVLQNLKHGKLNALTTAA